MTATLALSMVRVALVAAAARDADRWAAIAAGPRCYSACGAPLRQVSPLSVSTAGPMEAGRVPPAGAKRSMRRGEGGAR